MEESSSDLKFITQNIQMSAKDKNGLGYGTQLNEMSNKSKINSEISMSVFEVRSSDEEITPTNDRFSKADGYHVVPPPITGNFLTPRADISFADKVIIKDWNSDDEDDMSEVKTVSPVKTNKTQTVKTHVDKIGVLTRTCLVNPVRPNGKRAVHSVSTARPFVPKIAQTGSAIRPIYPRMDNVRPRASYSPIKRSYYTRPTFRPKNLKQDVKTSRVKNMTTAGTRAVVSTDNALKKPRWGNPEIFLQDHAVVDSGCSSHMIGNKAYLLDSGDYNGGFVAFG
ncbi:hypothetical protein Tco_1140169, partial [Tanacetum coccineum]